MTTIYDAYINALLADASCIKNLQTSDPKTDLGTALKSRMSPTLVQYLSANFTVLIQTANATPGFDATVWKDRTGKLYMTMHGTAAPGTRHSDVNLAVDASARNQLVEMVNWWLREITPAGHAARQVRTRFSGRDDHQWRFEAATPAAGTGRITVPDLAGSVDVNGHGLGGYLAAAFARLFGAQANIAHVSTFNGAGFAAGSEAIFQQLEQVIGIGYGRGHFPDATEQTNYFASQGINITANRFWFHQISQRADVR